MAEEAPPRKLVIIGDGACGKTCFLYRFCENKFTEGYIPTIFENYNKDYEYDGKRRMLRISDTAGQEDYEHVRPLAYPDTDVVFIAFSVVERASFENVKKAWFVEKEKYMKKARVLLIGTKKDLVDDNKTLEDLKARSGPEAAPVSKAEGEALAREIKAEGYYETSSKTNEGVTEAFHAAINAAEEPKPQQNGFCCFQ